MKKNILLIIILVISLFTLTNRIVIADSGWDSSYDGGYSWDSGSSWDNDSSWGSSNSGGSGIYVGGDLGETPPIVIIFLIIIIISIIVVSSKQHKNKSTNTISRSTNNKFYPDLTKEEIEKKDPTINIDELKQQAFNIYKNVQIAWMNFDDKTLRENLTDEIYNMYSSQLKTLKLKNQKNIMKDIILKNCKITSIGIENGIEKVTIYLNVSQYDYIIDKDKKVVRGTDKYKNNMEYLITLVRHIDNKKIEKCPNCGAGINITSGGICPYCESTIINNNEEFIMSKKECVGQCQEK